RIDWLNWTGASASRWRIDSEVWLRRYFPAALGGLAIALGALLLGPRALQSLRLKRRVQRAREGRASTADATLLYLRFLHLRSARGYSRPPWSTPTELARSVRPPELAAIAARFVAAYQELRFGGQSDAAPRLLILLEELERQG